jgi:hypothetical protein
LDLQDKDKEKEWKLEIKFVNGTLLVVPDFELDSEFDTFSEMLQECQDDNGFFTARCPNGDYHINISNIMYIVYSHSQKESKVIVLKDVKNQPEAKE